MGREVGPSPFSATRSLGRGRGKLPWRKATQEPNKLSVKTVSPKGARQRDGKWRQDTRSVNRAKHMKRTDKANEDPVGKESGHLKLSVVLSNGTKGTI